MSGGEGGGFSPGPRDDNRVPMWATLLVVVGALVLFGVAAYFATGAIREMVR